MVLIQLIKEVCEGKYCIWVALIYEFFFMNKTLVKMTNYPENCTSYNKDLSLLLPELKPDWMETRELIFFLFQCQHIFNM